MSVEKALLVFAAWTIGDGDRTMSMRKGVLDGEVVFRLHRHLPTKQVVGAGLSVFSHFSEHAELEALRTCRGIDAAYEREMDRARRDEETKLR